MKTKVLIIEDSAYKSFTTKQLLEAQLHMRIAQVDVADSQELARKTLELQPHLIMCCPKGGVAQVLDTMQKRKTNRRNTEITLLLAQEDDPTMLRQIHAFVAAYSSHYAVTKSAA